MPRLKVDINLSGGGSAYIGTSYPPTSTEITVPDYSDVWLLCNPSSGYGFTSWIFIPDGETTGNVVSTNTSTQIRTGSQSGTYRAIVEYGTANIKLRVWARTRFTDVNGSVTVQGVGTTRDILNVGSVPVTNRYTLLFNPDSNYFLYQVRIEKQYIESGEIKYTTLATYDSPPSGVEINFLDLDLAGGDNVYVYCWWNTKQEYTQFAQRPQGIGGYPIINESGEYTYTAQAMSPFTISPQAYRQYTFAYYAVPLYTNVVKGTTVYKFIYEENHTFYVRQYGQEVFVYYYQRPSYRVTQGNGIYSTYRGSTRVDARSFTVYSGETVHFKCYPKEHYKFNGWYINDVHYTDEYEFDYVVEETIVIRIDREELPKYKIYAEQVGGGGFVYFDFYLNRSDGTREEITSYTYAEVYEDEDFSITQNPTTGMEGEVKPEYWTYYNKAGEEITNYNVAEIFFNGIDVDTKFYLHWSWWINQAYAITSPSAGGYVTLTNGTDTSRSSGSTKANVSWTKGQSLTVDYTITGDDELYNFYQWIVSDTSTGKEILRSKAFQLTIDDSYLAPVSIVCDIARRITINTQVYPVNSGRSYVLYDGVQYGQWEFLANETVDIYAFPVDGYEFLHWECLDGASGEGLDLTQSHLSFPATKKRGGSWQATFRKKKVTVTAEVVGQGYVVGTGEFDYGSNVTLIANPNYGYAFISWEDGSRNQQRTLENVTENITVTATFTGETPEPVTEDDILLWYWITKKNKKIRLILK